MIKHIHLKIFNFFGIFTCNFVDCLFRGVACLRYEIRDIAPPPSVKYAMDMQAEAERKKRATVLDSEGRQQAEINVNKNKNKK
jgi:regulator of protease activity HflC (stomatin/prohibitin superfamily)